MHTTLLPINPFRKWLVLCFVVFLLLLIGYLFFLYSRRPWKFVLLNRVKLPIKDLKPISAAHPDDKESLLQVSLVFVGKVELDKTQVCFIFSFVHVFFQLATVEKCHLNMFRFFSDSIEQDPFDHHGKMYLVVPFEKLSKKDEKEDKQCPPDTTFIQSCKENQRKETSGLCFCLLTLSRKKETLCIVKRKSKKKDDDQELKMAKEIAVNCLIPVPLFGGQDIPTKDETTRISLDLCFNEMKSGLLYGLFVKFRCVESTSDGILTINHPLPENMSRMSVENKVLLIAKENADEKR